MPWKDTSQGEVRTPVDEPRPYGGVRETQAGDGAGRLMSSVDPSIGSQCIPVEAPGPLWKNRPSLHRKSKFKSHVYLGKPKRYRQRETGAASAGNAVPGPTGAVTAQAKVQGRKPGSTRFAEVLHMFDRLRQDGWIEAYWPVPPSPQEAEHRGDVAAWRFPRPPRGRGRPSAWFRLDPVQEVDRAAMVRAVRCDGDLLYWIEIELREKKSGYRSLLFTVDDHPPDEVIRDLLGIAVREKGIWPSGQELVEEVSVVNAEGWTHSQVGGKLNGGRALEAMRAVLFSASADGGTGPVMTPELRRPHVHEEAHGGSQAME